MLRNQPIKRKLMTVNLLTSAVVLLLVCGTFLAYELLTFRQTMIRNLSTLDAGFDRDRVLRREWRGVKVAGHAQEVLDFVEAD